MPDGAGDEFALIARYFAPLATDAGAAGLLDDAAVVSPPAGQDLVVTKDMLAAGVHFFADDPPQTLARKALRVNLSDLAAKGAEPLGYFLGMGFGGPPEAEWMQAFSDALAEDQRLFGLTLMGGDTIGTRGGLLLSITALGLVPEGRCVRRQGGKAGDILFVSGTLGDGALGLLARKGALDDVVNAGARDDLIDRYHVPQPRVALAGAVRDHASAAMDISDGLLGDLGKLCAASGCGARLEQARVPLSEEARAVLDIRPDLWPLVLDGGDDYEILCAVPQARAASFSQAAADAGVAVCRIGAIESQQGVRLIDLEGQNAGITPRSFTHF